MAKLREEDLVYQERWHGNRLHHLACIDIDTKFLCRDFAFINMQYKKSVQVIYFVQNYKIMLLFLKIFVACSC